MFYVFNVCLIFNVFHYKKTKIVFNDILRRSVGYVIYSVSAMHCGKIIIQKEARAVIYSMEILRYFTVTEYDERFYHVFKMFFLFPHVLTIQR